VRKLVAAVLPAVLLLPFLMSALPGGSGEPDPVGFVPKIIRGPQLTHPDPLVWPTPPFISIPDPGLLGPPTRDAIGTARVLVLLARFTGPSDPVPSETRGDIDAKVNSVTTPSMRTYYSEVSYNQLLIQATVVDWVNVGPMAEYGTDSAQGTDDANGPVYRLVTDAVRGAALEEPAAERRAARAEHDEVGALGPGDLEDPVGGRPALRLEPDRHARREDPRRLAERLERVHPLVPLDRRPELVRELPLGHVRRHALTRDVEQGYLRVVHERHGRQRRDRGAGVGRAVRGDEDPARGLAALAHHQDRYR